MRRYEYECRTCGITHYDTMRGLEGTSCPRERCAGTLKRIYTVAITWPKSQRGH